MHNCPTYTVIVRLMTDLVRFSGITCGIAILFLYDTSVGSIKGLGDIHQHVVGLKLTISRSISREGIIRDVLNQWIIPATATESTELLGIYNYSGIAYLLIMRALTTIASPSMAPLAINAFCSSKYVTKLGP